MVKYRTLPSEMEKKVPDKLIGKSKAEIMEWASRSLYDRNIKADINTTQIDQIRNGTLKKIILKPKGTYFFRQNILTGEIQAVKTLDLKLKPGEDIDQKVDFEEKIFLPWLEKELAEISRENIKDLLEEKKIWIYYCHVKRVKKFLSKHQDKVTKGLIWERINRNKVETFGKQWWYNIWYLEEWLPELQFDSPELFWGTFTLFRLTPGIKNIEVRNHWRTHMLEGRFDGVDLRKIWIAIKSYKNNGELITEIQRNYLKDVEVILRIHGVMNKKLIPENTDIEELRRLIPSK